MVAPISDDVVWGNIKAFAEFPEGAKPGFEKSTGKLYVDNSWFNWGNPDVRCLEETFKRGYELLKESQTRDNELTYRQGLEKLKSLIPLFEKMKKFHFWRVHEIYEVHIKLLSELPRGAAKRRVINRNISISEPHPKKRNLFLTRFKKVVQTQKQPNTEKSKSKPKPQYSKKIQNFISKIRQPIKGDVKHELNQAIARRDRNQSLDSIKLMEKNRKKELMIKREDRIAQKFNLKLLNLKASKQEEEDDDEDDWSFEEIHTPLGGIQRSLSLPSGDFQRFREIKPLPDQPLKLDGTQSKETSPRSRPDNSDLLLLFQQKLKKRRSSLMGED